MPHAAHQKAVVKLKVSPENRYNTRERRLQGQYLMENHVTTTKNPTYIPSNPAPLVHPVGEDWSIIDQVTGNINLEPG